jgi:hypothetical protein
VSEAAFEKAVAEGFKQAMNEALKPGSEVDVEQKADKAAEAIGEQPPTVAPHEVTPEDGAGQEEHHDPVDEDDLLAEPDFGRPELEDEGDTWEGDDWSSEVESVASEPVFEPRHVEPPPDDEQPDDETERLRRQLQAERSARLIAETKASQLEKQTNLDLEAKRRLWVKVDSPHYPLAAHAAEELAAQATSRKHFVRLLKGEQARMRPHFEKFLEGEKASIAAERERVREEAKRAWGVPVSGPQMPQEAVESRELREKIENAATLKERIKLRIQAGDI